MTSPRNAPRRESVSVTKVGKYGHVVWAHQLVCGHTITRKRKSPTGILGCVKCIEASDFEELSQGLATPVEAPMDDGLSEAEAEALKTKALLAGRFNVSLEQVDVAVRASISGMMEVESATVTFTRRQLQHFR